MSELKEYDKLENLIKKMIKRIWQDIKDDYPHKNMTDKLKKKIVNKVISRIKNDDNNFIKFIRHYNLEDYVELILWNELSD